MKISVIGVGAMGGSLVEGLLKSVFNAVDITVADPYQPSLDKFEKMGVSVTTNNAVAAGKSDVVIVVVKPWLVQGVINEIKDSLNYKKQRLVIVAAGVKGSDVLTWLNKDGEVPTTFLCIPNIAISELASMTFLAPISANDEDIKIIRGIFAKVGSVKVVEERLLAAGCTIASCGIAYAMRYIRASIEGSVELGYKAKDAQDIVLQTVKGAVELLQANGNHPEAEIDKVTTPGGVTIKGLNAMEKNGFTNAVIEGLKAGM